MSKFNAFYFFLCWLISSTANGQSGQVVLSGEIKNNVEDSIVVKNNFEESVFVVDIFGEKFNDTIEVNEGYYSFRYGRHSMSLFLKPGTELFIHFDGKNPAGSASFKGVGEVENDYLAKKMSLTQAIPMQARAYNFYAKKSEEAFLAQTDSIYQLYIDHFNQYSFPSGFEYLERNSIVIARAVRLAMFEEMKRMVEGNTTFEVSDKYPDPYTGIDLNNPELLNTTNYHRLLNYLVTTRVRNAETFSDASDFPVLFMEYLAQSDFVPEIKDRLGYQNAEAGFKWTEDKERVYQVFMEFAHSIVLKEKFHQMYQNIDDDKGKPSPDFRFLDVDSKEYSLNNFQGKYIYIDVWASWCGPCIQQLPFLKELKKEFSNKVHFISVAWNDNKSDWRNAIDRLNLEGIQLFAENKDAPFFTFYDISAIPRFILLDKEGKIIETRARPPSLPSLRNQLISLE